MVVEVVLWTLYIIIGLAVVANIQLQWINIMYLREKKKLYESTLRKYESIDEAADRFVELGKLKAKYETAETLLEFMKSHVEMQNLFKDTLDNPLLSDTELEEKMYSFKNMDNQYIGMRGLYNFAFGDLHEKPLEG